MDPPFPESNGPIKLPSPVSLPASRLWVLLTLTPLDSGPRTSRLSKIPPVSSFRVFMSEPSGLLGMAFKTISDYNADPVFQSLVAAGQTDKGVFSFKLASSGSQLYLGGTDNSKYSGDFTYSKVTKEVLYSSLSAFHIHL
jgi:hypothetical protein